MAGVRGVLCSWSSPTDQLVRKFKDSVAFTTHAKPHAQQQLPRDLEVERAAMGQRCRPQISARCSEAIRNHVDGWISGEQQLFCCIADVRGTVVGALLPISLPGNLKIVFGY